MSLAASVATPAVRRSPTSRRASRARRSSTRSSARSSRTRTATARWSSSGGASRPSARWSGRSATTTSSGRRCRRTRRASGCAPATTPTSRCSTTGRCEPLWSVQVDTKRSTYDADEDTYLVATMPRTGPPDLVALDADTGKRRWCASLGGPHVGEADPFATQLLGDGGCGGARPGHERSAADRPPRPRREPEVGQSRCTPRRVTTSGLAGEGLLVAGGRPAYELSDERALRGGASQLVALELGSGRKAWQTPELQDSGSHVVGAGEGRVIVLQRRPEGGAEVLVAYDEEGAVQWSVLPELPAPLDVALRNGRILVRSADRARSPGGLRRRHRPAAVAADDAHEAAVPALRLRARRRAAGRRRPRRAGYDDRAACARPRHRGASPPQRRCRPTASTPRSGPTRWRCPTTSSPSRPTRAPSCCVVARQRRRWLMTMGDSKRSAATSASYSITMRLHTVVDPSLVGRIATAISAEGGIVTALDVAESRHDRIVVDVTCSATNSEHADEVVAAVRTLDGRDRAQGLRPHVPAPHRRQDRGHLQGPAAHARRPVDGLHARRRPGQPGPGTSIPRTCRG